MTRLTRLGRFLCGLFGHDYVTQRTKDRLYLVCINCGEETSGWNLGRICSAAEEMLNMQEPEGVIGIHSTE